MAQGLLKAFVVEQSTENKQITKRKNMKNIIKHLAVAAVVAGGAGSAYATPLGAAIQISSGATTYTIQDNGTGDLSPVTGNLIWDGSLNGWNVVVTVGQTFPVLGSITSPEMDLGVSASGGGAANLTVMFTDTGFGPTSGGVNSVGKQVGTSSATYATYYDTGDAQFTLSSAFTGGVNLASPYSITLVDTFTPGTISSDQRVTVPDGGATAMLLGAALTGVGLLRKKLTA